MSAALLLDALCAHPEDNLVLQDSSQCLSASSLLAHVHTLAEQLRPCRVLAVLADNGADWVLADLAALHAQTVHLPIPTFFSPAQMVHTLEQTAADAILTDQPNRVEALRLGFVAEGTWRTFTLMRRTSAAATLPAGTAKISFTSGSTGNPKGVCLSAAGLMATATSLQTQLAPLHITRHLAVLPLTLLLENTAGIYAALLSGAQVHLPSLSTMGWRGMTGFDPAALQQTVATHAPHSLILVPELLKAWTLYLTATRQQASTSLAYVAVGGARVDHALLAQARAVGIPAYEGYGLTECGSVVSLNRPGDEGQGVGRPLPHVKVRVENQEIHLTTPAFLGYVNSPSASSGVTPTADFSTGDLGYLDNNGHLYLSGRRKNLLITAFGRNISPEWVESVLLAQPAIAQAVVTGEAQPWLCAVLVPMPGATPEQISAAVTQANATLPDYARIGGWLSSEPFTLQNTMATGNGRPVRTAIAQHHAAALAALYTQKEPTHDVL